MTEVASSTLYFSEEIRTSLQEFATQQSKPPVPSNLFQIVENISKTGVSCFPWTTLKYLLATMLQESLQRFHDKTLENRKNDFNIEQAEAYKKEEEEFQQQSQKFFQALNSYEDAPFTLQRLCELILNPEKSYTSTKKYITALEKMVNITSTIPTLTNQEIQTINTTGVVTASPTSNASANAFDSMGGGGGIFGSPQHHVLGDGTFSNTSTSNTNSNNNNNGGISDDTSSPMDTM